jgi:hypothetical protein
MPLLVRHCSVSYVDNWNWQSCWNYEVVQVNIASVYTLLWWYMYSKGTIHMNLTVLNEQLTNKKYSIRLTKYILVLIHDHISHTYAHIHLCLCLPFNNTALIKYHQFNQMQLTYRYLSIYVFSFLWHCVLHLSTPMGLCSILLKLFIALSLE